MFALCGCAHQHVVKLTSAEKKTGWKLLFDRQTTRGWHSFKKQTCPEKRWAVEDGWLHCLGKPGGDIVSDAQFDQFELQLAGSSPPMATAASGTSSATLAAKRSVMNTK